MKNKIFFIIIFVLTANACKNSPLIVENATLFTKEDFIVTKKLTGEILDMDSLWKPTRIWVHNSSLITVDSYTDYFVQSYDSKTTLKKAENIARGIGPNELLNCWSLQFNDDIVWAFDMQQAKINAYQLPDFIEKSNISPISSTKFNGAPTSVVALFDNSFLCSDLSDPKNLVTHYDRYGNKDKELQIAYPEILAHDIPENLQKRFWEYRIYHNPQNKKTVIFYTYTDLIDIYDSNMQLEQRIQGPDCFIPILGNRQVDGQDFAYLIPEKTKFAYLFGVLTETEIWTLYYGISPQQGKEKQHTIFVFDYQGNPLRHYELDTPITYFGVDTKNKCLYGLSEKPEPVIIKYQY